MSEVFDKVIASLGKIPSPFEVGRKLGLNIPTGEDITGEDIKNILSIIGPQADIKAMVEESSRIVPALKKGDIPEALSGLVLSALAPFMLGIPGTVSGIRKGSEGLSKELVRNVSKSLRHPVGGEYKHIPTRTREIGLESLREPTIESIETGTLHHMDDRWLRNKIKKAREDRAIELKRQRKAVKETPDYTSQPSYTSTIGSSEGVTASISKMNINPKRLENMPGAMGEEILRKEGFKLDNLLKSISKEGYDPTKGRILIHVREDGQPFIVEGNHRLAAALLTKQSSIPVEIKYLRGSESIVGPLNPKRLASLGEQSKSTGGLSGLGESRKIKAKPKQKKPDVENLGKELSDAQMIGPERTMPHVLNAMHESDAGYAAGYLVEHIGDLTRKMGDGVGVLGPVKLRDIKEKVGKGLRKLRYGNVEGEFNESMKGKNVKKLNKLFEKYADEHSKLPIFNKPQWLAREAAVSVGKKDFNRTRELLEELEILIDNPNNFYKLNSSIDPAFSSKLKGSGGLSSLGESRKIKAKPKHKSSDLVTHAASVSDLPSIAKGGLRSGTHVEPAGDKIWAEGLHRLIYNKLPEDVGKLVSRMGMEDMPFYKLQQSIDADEIKMIEFPAEDYPDILKETKRLKKLFGKTKVRPYWQNENGKIFYSESAADKSQAVLDRKSAKRAAEKIAYEESQMQPGFYVDRMTDQRPTLKYDPGQPDWEDLKRSTGGLVGLI